MTTVFEVQDYLKIVFGRYDDSLLLSDKDPVAAVKNGILLDFASHVLLFAKAHCFDPPKMSTLFSIAINTHTKSMNRQCTDVESFEIFEKYIIQHSVSQPPSSEAVFNVDDVKAINQYFTDTYFRNYKMYLFVFVKGETAMVNSVYGKGNVQFAATPRPLCEALLEEEWLQLEHEREEASRIAEEEQQQEAQRMKMQKPVTSPEEEGQKQDTGPVPPLGLKAQLEVIRGMVQKMTGDKLTQLEAKLTAIEEKVVEIEAEKEAKGAKGAKGGKKK